VPEYEDAVLLMVFLISARQSALKMEEQVPLSVLVFLTLRSRITMAHSVCGVLGSENFSKGLRSCQYISPKVVHTPYAVFNPIVCHLTLSTLLQSMISST
jgi:hypothetical protein